LLARLRSLGDVGRRALITIALHSVMDDLGSALMML